MSSVLLPPVAVRSVVSIILKNRSRFLECNIVSVRGSRDPASVVASAHVTCPALASSVWVQGGRGSRPQRWITAPCSVSVACALCAASAAWAEAPGMCGASWRRWHRRPMRRRLEPVIQCWYYVSRVMSVWRSCSAQRTLEPLDGVGPAGAALVLLGAPHEGKMAAWNRHHHFNMLMDDNGKNKCE